MNREPAENITADLKKFPPLQEYIQGLKELMKMNLSVLTTKEMADVFYKRVVLFQQVFGLNPSECFNEREFYRVRMNIQENEDENLLRTYSYPPASACEKNGRANLSGRSVFYCSDHAGTALLESKPKEGQIGYLSVWRGNAFRDVKYGVCLNEELKAENPYWDMKNTVNKFVKDEAVKMAGGKSEHFIQFYNFVAERFVNEGSPYSLTSWIANEMLYEGQWKDYIIYPSKANAGDGCNMAFHPNSADTMLRFSKVMKFNFLSKEGSYISLNNIRIGELDQNRMNWRKAYESELREIMPAGNYLK